MVGAPSVKAAQPFGPNTIADIAERVTPAVVSITVEKPRLFVFRTSSGNHPMFKDTSDETEENVKDRAAGAVPEW